MNTKEDQDRLESTLEQANPRLRLYTLAQQQPGRRQITAAPTPLEDWQALQDQIAAAKAGG